MCDKRKVAAYRAARECPANVELGRIVADARKLREACDVFLRRHYTAACQCPLCRYARRYWDDGPRNDLIVVRQVLEAFGQLVGSARPLTQPEWEALDAEIAAEAAAAR